MKKNVLLIGGFNKAKSLSISLIAKGYKVTTINQTYEHCKELAKIQGLIVINGDGTRPYILEDANANEMDIAIALTTRDDNNLIICELCKKKYNIKKTVALVNDANKTEFFYRMGIDSVVCATNAITSIIEQQAFIDEVETYIPISEGKISIIELPITANAPTIGKKLWEIDLPKEVIIGCILRNEHSMIPRGDTRILEGDILVVISGDKKELDAVKELTGK